MLTVQILTQKFKGLTSSLGCWSTGHPTECFPTLWWRQVCLFKASLPKIANLYQCRNIRLFCRGKITLFKFLADADCVQ